MTPILCCWQYGRISFSTPRFNMEYGGCSEVIGAIFEMRSICATEKFDTPMYRTLPSCFNLRQGFPTFFDFAFGIRPVDLVEIDDIHLKAAQARLQLVADGITLQAAMNLILGLPEFPAPDHRALGEDVWLLLSAFERTSHHFFRVAKPVDRCRIDPVDAKVEGALDRGDRIVVVLRTPAKLPVAAADGPGAKTDGGDLQVRIAKLPSCRLYRFRDLHTFFDAVPSVRMRR